MKKMTKYLFFIFFVFVLVGCSEEIVEVGFDSMGGTPTESIFIEVGETISPPSATKEGYTFIGWYRSSNEGITLDERWSFLNNTVNHDITLYAKWEINQYIISFEAQGGTEVSSITQDFDTEVIKPTTEKEGHTFRGWYLDEEYEKPYNFSTMPAEDIILYARWEVNIYEVIFLDTDGTVMETVIISHGSILDVNAPSLNVPYGHELKGWFADTINFQSDMIVTRSYTFRPEIERKSIYIEDVFLQEALRELGYEVSNQGNIDYLEAQEITSLTLKNRDIYSLKGLEYFRNLEFLNVSNNHLETLSVLLNLEHLDVVKVANNKLPFSHWSTTHETYDLTELEELRASGVQVQNAHFQRVIPHVKTTSNTDYMWRVLMVLVVEVDIVLDGEHIVSTVDDHVKDLAVHYARIFENAVNHLVPDNVFIEVDYILTESVHEGSIQTYSDHEGRPSYFLFGQDLIEIHELISDYDSVIVLHNLKDNTGFAGLGGFDWEHYVGTASIRFETFEAVHEGFFGYEQVPLIEKLALNYMDWGALVLINEFIHGLDFYAIYELNLDMNHQYDMASFYEDSIVDDYGKYDFDRSLTRDYLRMFGHLRGQSNDIGTLVGLLYDVWGVPPRLNRP